MPGHEKISGPVDEVLRPLITRIKVESAYLPPIQIEDPFGPSTGKVDKVAATLKPKVTFETPGGPIVIAPAGEPGPTRWPLVKGSVLVLSAFGIFGMFALSRRK